jgi:hypothetical protein
LKEIGIVRITVKSSWGLFILSLTDTTRMNSPHEEATQKKLIVIKAANESGRYRGIYPIICGYFCGGSLLLTNGAFLNLEYEKRESEETAKAEPAPEWVRH